jgi:hypothetical protein
MTETKTTLNHCAVCGTSIEGWATRCEACGGETGGTYRLSCFFRDLPVAGDTEMGETLRRKLAAMTAGERQELGEAARQLLRATTPPLPAGETTIELLRMVAEDAANLIGCNCSYTTLSEQRCDGTCTHSMATRALQQLQAQARWLDDLNWDASGYTTLSRAALQELVAQEDGKQAPPAAATALAQVVGTVSIEGGIATLPDGSTVDLKAEQEQAQARWCQRLIDAYGALLAGDVFFDPQGESEDAQLEGATEPLGELVVEAHQYLARGQKAAHCWYCQQLLAPGAASCPNCQKYQLTSSDWHGKDEARG